VRVEATRAIQTGHDRPDESQENPMFRMTRAALCVAVLLGVSAGSAQAQLGVSISAGAYVPGNDFQQLRDAAGDVRVARSSTLGVGANLHVGPLRLSAAYATGATLSEGGVQNGRDVGDGSVLAAAAAYVLRPIPRLIVVQPYLLGGLGVKMERFSFEEGVDRNRFTRDQSELAVQIGVGADVSLGPVSLIAEVTDYITRRDGGFGQHDAFVLVGLKFGL
jgi:outer membrane scaffolding protein for murein synthesis (MipA/OmpV family)